MMSGRRPLIAGNWKMNGKPLEGASLARELRSALQDPPAVDIMVFPPFLSINTAVEALKGTDITVGGQDLHPEAGGAFTGNVSGEMLKAAGCKAVLVGHSERRTYEKESGELLAAKVAGALRAGLQVIFCCGETSDERDAAVTQQVVVSQLNDGLGDLRATEMEQVVVAYEPVWAIGTGRVASPEQAQEVHATIRSWAAKTWDSGSARALRILYGGSVKPTNVAGIMAQPDIDGALVGGASLNADSFQGIVCYGGR
tara:strand:- start:674 stop:1441 length:768 start_codon:yes stop_codon:yes gene_type:complete